MHHRHHSCAHPGARGRHGSHHRGHRFGRHFAAGMANRLFGAPVNIHEKADRYELFVFAPGLSKADFNIQLADDLLTISYKNEKQEAEINKWLHQEFKQRSFERRFRINEKVDTEKISARYEDGILNVGLPKKEGMESLFQEISVA